MRFPARNIARCGVLLAFVLGQLACQGENARPSEYEPPSLNGFVAIDQYAADGDGDGVNETQIQKYQNVAGDSLVSMSTKDRLWAWSLDTQGGDDQDVSRNYVIRDSNCNGSFDERYTLDDQFHIPDCLR